MAGAILQAGPGAGPSLDRVLDRAESSGAMSSAAPAVEARKPMFFSHTLYCRYNYSLRLHRQSTPRRNVGSRRESAGARAWKRSSYRTSCTAGSRAPKATVSSSVAVELEQRASEGLLRGDSDDGTLARYKSRTQSRPNGSMRTGSSHSRKEPQEGCGHGTAGQLV